MTQAPQSGIFCEASATAVCERLNFGQGEATMEIVFLLYDGMTALDVIGPHEVLSRLPNAVVRRVAKRSGSVKTDSGVELIADYGFNDVSRADLLLIPGAASATDMRDDPETLAWVRDVHATTTWTTSVCTGSLILGAAGLVSGLKATLAKATKINPMRGSDLDITSIITAIAPVAGGITTKILPNS